IHKVSDDDDAVFKGVRKVFDNGAVKDGIFSNELNSLLNPDALTIIPPLPGIPIIVDVLVAVTELVASDKTKEI
ncbi:19139_t:CDS:2, partial [Rhizophagus irregularis]